MDQDAKDAFIQQMVPASGDRKIALVKQGEASVRHGEAASEYAEIDKVALERAMLEKEVMNLRGEVALSSNQGNPCPDFARRISVLDVDQIDVEVNTDTIWSSYRAIDKGVDNIVTSTSATTLY